MGKGKIPGGCYRVRRIGTKKWLRWRAPFDDPESVEAWELLKQVEGRRYEPGDGVCHHLYPKQGIEVIRPGPWNVPKGPPSDEEGRRKLERMNSA